MERRLHRNITWGSTIDFTTRATRRAASLRGRSGLSTARRDRAAHDDVGLLAEVPLSGLESSDKATSETGVMIAELEESV
ncbi:hypothetical protein NDU88_000790 [Pleurodeles waltl]|uniref:Uncharacterized protein n=1 Tax=Pleurodeles waltl TaxID=8319 RepID=A0AAV7LVP2_PLEWA|nr:hypothetical protein NDU88_000790 [Pleurodeles waltl]